MEKAIKNNPQFAISDADQEGSGYTAHLMQKLKRRYPDVDFSFVIGSDNLKELHLWYDYPYLAKELHFLILPRPGYALLPEVISQLKATVLNIELCPVSATEIRQRIKNRESIKGMVPEELEQEIIQLYRETGI
ncbi:MAG: putative nicotinate-nucleotide adenylyltransferase [Bacteroidetes bacterium ADurb.Bin041]|nr:MAG: putative nicotinate-nucleotide adenylyltransferase [Bacteroidetes bacterium ADurb.Bin041]